MAIVMHYDRDKISRRPNDNDNNNDKESEEDMSLLKRVV